MLPFRIYFHLHRESHISIRVQKKKTNWNSPLYKTYEWLTIHRIFNIRVYTSVRYE